MEAYLSQCLDSLLVENLKDVEVWVVNDGSKDKTLEIANSYHERFPDSIKVIDKPNGNYGSCINAALKVTTGKYVKVLDADDSFEKNNFNDFISFLTDTDSDLVISDYVIVNEEGEITRKCAFLDLGEGKSIEFGGVLDVISDHRFQMHAVTYRKSIFEKIEYHQQEGISYTDQQWMFEPMNEVESVSFFPKVVYRYLVGRVGQTVDVSVSYKNLNQTIKVVERMLEDYNKLQGGKDKVHQAYLEQRLMQKIPSLYRIALLKSNDEELITSLYNFDKHFEVLNPSLYKKTGIDKISFIQLPYVGYWRKKIREGKSPLFLEPLRRMVMRLYRL